MQKYLNLAAKIKKELDINWQIQLEELNLHTIFEYIYTLDTTIEIQNTLICAIIYSYDKDSQWYNLNKTSYEDKVNILEGLKADMNNEFLIQFIELSNENINNSIGDFLDRQTDWRIAQIMRSRDYHSTALKAQEPRFDDVDEDKAVRAKENFGKYLREAINHRKISDEYIAQIEKEYVNLNHRVQQDFGSSFAQTSIELHSNNQRKINPESWRHWIRYTKPEWEKKKLVS